MNSTPIDDLLQHWDQHRTPFSPVQDCNEEVIQNEITFVLNSHQEVEPNIWNDNSMKVPDTKCKIMVRHAHKSTWIDLIQMETWYSLPYKYIFQITVPFLKASQIEINLIKEFGIAYCNQHIHYALRNPDLPETQSQRFEFSVFFSTSSHAENQSKFILQLKHRETRQVLFTSQPTTIFTRKRSHPRMKYDSSVL
jgi:hypothetical protein